MKLDGGYWIILQNLSPSSQGKKNAFLSLEAFLEVCAMCVCTLATRDRQETIFRGFRTLFGEWRDIVGGVKRSRVPGHCSDLRVWL